jgi:mycothiol synthase
MELSVCATDDEYESWRAVRLAVEPGSRTPSVEELRARDSSDQLLLLALEDGHVIGCGLADRAETGGAGFVMPRVLPQHRRLGCGVGPAASPGRALQRPAPVDDVGTCR